MGFPLHYIAEDAWPMLVACVCMAVGFLVALKVSGQAKFLAFAAIVLAIGAIVFLVEQLWVTDNERIEKAVYDLANDVRMSNVDGVIERLAPDLSFTSGDKSIAQGPRALELVRVELTRTHFDALSISHLETSVATKARLGEAQFRVFCSGTRLDSVLSANFVSAQTEWSLGFEESQPSVWKVTRITPTRLPMGYDLLNFRD